MSVLDFIPGHSPELFNDPSEQVPGRFLWADVQRSDQDWHQQIEKWLGCSLHENHLFDCQNEAHPPFYDSTDDYDFLVFRAAVSGEGVEVMETQPLVFILTAQAVISLGPPGSCYFSKLREQLLASPKKNPDSPLGMLYLLIDQLIDGLLERRNRVTELLSIWQERLLDRDDGFGDWRALMKLQSQLRRLEVVTESQLDALSDFREQTPLQLTSSHAVHFNDLDEHLKRVYDHALVMQTDIDGMVQIFFSSNTQKTNEILKFLAIISAIFLPLNLLAALFGMNFTHMPFLQADAAPWLFLGLMALIVGLLLTWFHRQRWL